MGFVTVALGRGKDKESLAIKLGAKYYVDSGSSAPAEELQKLGGARVVLATAPDAQSISALVGGLSADGKLLIVAAATEPLVINALELMSRRGSIQAWPSGTAKDSEDTLRFSAVTGIRPMIEKYPLSSVEEAFNRMITGKVRFRSVLTM
jgi:D-arabinose 1-dehydrogenase-like Zn-dependent alcohol dehydrogenase